MAWTFEGVYERSMLSREFSRQVRSPEDIHSEKRLGVEFQRPSGNSFFYPVEGLYEAFQSHKSESEALLEACRALKVLKVELPPELDTVYRALRSEREEKTSALVQQGRGYPVAEVRVLGG